ncbi:hypothetical protein D9Q98_000202 [Chlorella vulgaris]|uniref:DNL-type domain-containing protein n=1 Tax=Chlorella vulgaris TaxID=3077 RepID=A0A9D4Z1C0_CHLVU|nr:hypothetical protein D9Q98_000202 [Chlorella vulgaris]
MQVARPHVAAAPLTGNPRRSYPRRPLVACTASHADGRPFDRPATAATPETWSGAASPSAATPLPGGALWWHHWNNTVDPLYGNNFVLQRPRVGGPGLVRAVQQPKPVRQPAAAPATAVVWKNPSAGGGLVLGSSLCSGSVVIDTDFEVLQPPLAPTMLPNTTCVGLVWQPAEGEEGTAEVEPGSLRRNSKHPRRTQALRYTCNLCGEVNDAVVNPHAWTDGSVFARCQGCTAVHKLKDNLKIFTELAGPVFPPRDLRSNYLVQEILDRIQENNRN